MTFRIDYISPKRIVGRAGNVQPAPREVAFPPRLTVIRCAGPWITRIPRQPQTEERKSA